MIILQNNDYYVRINLEGGQVSRFRGEVKGIEYIHDANKEDWDYSTPTLFPIVGSSYDKRYHFKGHSTTMANHGFLRQEKFMLKSHIDNVVTLRFEANENTMEQFPYYFAIEIAYSLNDNKLLVEYEIFNEGVIPMPFNFGIQPAFTCPLDSTKSFEDYKITFSSPTHLKGVGPLINTGLVKEIPLSYEMFEEYPEILYHRLESSTIGITDGENGLNLSVVGFPLVGIWTKRDQKAPFICFSPSLGAKKSIEKDLDFKDRDAVMSLEANKSFRLTYTIEVY